MSLSQPVESHEVAMRLKLNRDIKWIAYFSDPLPCSILPAPYRYSSRIPGRNFLRERKVTSILNRADAIILPNQYMMWHFESELGVSISKKTVIIPHIGTEIDYSNNAASKDYSGWLMHIGEITPHRVCVPFLKALKILISKRKFDFPGLLCVGKVCTEFRNLVSELGLQSIVNYTGQIKNNTRFWQSHRRSVQFEIT
jgi:hypothetical protein